MTGFRRTDPTLVPVGSYTEYQNTYIHARGDSELVGDGFYGPLAGIVFGGYVTQVAAYTEVDVVRATIACLNQDRAYLTMNIFIRNDDNAFETNGVTPDYTGAVYNVPHSLVVRDYHLNSTLRVAANKYVHVLWASPAGNEIVISRFTTIGSNPARLGLHYSSTSTYSQRGSPSSGFAGIGMQFFKQARSRVQYRPVWVHPRGDAEVSGNGLYSAGSSGKVMGFYQQISENIEFNSVTCRVFCSTLQQVVLYVFLRDSATAFNPKNEIPAIKVSYSSGEFPSADGTFNFSFDRIAAAAGKYVFVLFNAESAGNLSIAYFNAASSDPARNRFVISTTGINATFSFSSGAFYAASFKLSLATNRRMSLQSWIDNLDMNLPFNPMNSGMQADNINEAVIEAYNRGGGAGIEAANVSYDHAASGLSAIQVNAAIDELDGRLDAIVPRVILPNDFTAVVGYNFQLFTRGFVEAPDPYSVPHEMLCSVGANYPRYYEITPVSEDVGEKIITIKILDINYNLKSTTTTSLFVVNAIGQPSANKNVLCIGDSLTAGGQWPTEFYRMLTQTGGSPAGKGYGNITFIGETALTGFPTQYFVGNGGWSVATYLGETSPFWNAGLGRISFTDWVASKGFGGIDVVYILLGWNGLTKQNAYSSGSHSTEIGYYQTFIDRIHADYPGALVRVLSPQVPSCNGGLAYNYGATADWQYYSLLRSLNGLRLAYKDMITVSYSSFGRYLDIACRLDSENNMSQAAVAVNSRNSATEMRGTNGVHPELPGLLQIADVAFCDFIRTFCS